MKLLEIKEALETADLYATVSPPSDDNPLPHVKVLLSDDEAGDFLLELAYLPGIAEDLEHTKLLQFFVPLLESDPAHRLELLRLLMFLNESTPVPGFTLDMEGEMIFYRYSMPLPMKSTADFTPTLLDMTFLIFYQIVLYIDVIKSVAAGEKKFEETLLPLE